MLSSSWGESQSWGSVRPGPGSSARQKWESGAAECRGRGPTGRLIRPVTALDLRAARDRAHLGGARQRGGTYFETPWRGNCFLVWVSFAEILTS